jgi:hypothetical protein
MNIQFSTENNQLTIFLDGKYSKLTIKCSKFAYENPEVHLYNNDGNLKEVKLTAVDEFIDADLKGVDIRKFQYSENCVIDYTLHD